MRRWLCFVATLICPILGWPQVDGRLYLEKTTFAVDEPVFLYLEITNNGTKPIEIESADAYSFCSGYQIHVTGDPGRDWSCAVGFVGSCLSGGRVIKPKETFRQRRMLNEDHHLDKPGDYDLEAVRSVGYSDVGRGIFPSASTFEIRDQEHFTIDSNAKSDPALVNQLARQLSSKDPQQRIEAARILATIAPPSLEDTLLAFAGNSELRQFAPKALFRLNTAKSLAALGDLFVHSEPGIYESMESARYLAATGDPKWFPLLSSFAKEHTKIANYVDDAAQSGGEQAIPLLLELSRSSDKQFTAINGMQALGSTGSRAAVPLLIEFLKSPDSDTAQRALQSLRQLTHVSFSGEHWWEHPQSQYKQWRSWWNKNGGTAPIYKATECGEVTALE